MIRDLGYVEPGTTIYLPFHTFDSNDPSASVTLTGLATSDIEIYKDGSVTQRASDNGYTLLDTDGIDFDGITGIHGLSISLADNTTAGFYSAGSQYWVVVSSVTVDAATINFVLCTFRIGYQGAMLNTTIATLSSQISFTLTNGPAEDDALNGCIVLIHDVASAVQKGWARVEDYTGSTKTVTLAAGTTFTAAATDNISFFMPAYAAAANITSVNGSALSVSTAVPANVTHFNGVACTSSGGRPEVNTTHAAGTAWGSSAITAAALATDAVQEIRNAITGGAYALDTDANGRVRIVDGTGAGEIDTASGVVLAKDHTGANLATASALDAVDNFIDTEIADIQGRLPAALVGGRMGCTIDSTGLETSAVQKMARNLSPAQGTIRYVRASGGNDGNDGLTWDTALATIGAAVSASSAGDTIRLGSGSWDIGISPVTMPDGVNLIGSGKYATIITSSTCELTANGAMVRPGSNALVKDLSIICTVAFAPSSTFSACLGCHGQSGVTQAPFTDARLENLYLQGVTDCIFTQPDVTYSSFIGRNITMKSNWDGVFSNGSSFELHDSDVWCESAGVSVDSAGVLVSTDARVLLKNCTIRCLNQDGGFTGNVSGIDASSMNDDSVLVIEDCSIATTGSGSTFDILGPSTANGAIFFHNVRCSTSKISDGNSRITYLPEHVNLFTWRMSSPLTLVSGRVNSYLDASGLQANAASEIEAAVWAGSSRTLTAIDEDSTTLDLDATIQAALSAGVAVADFTVAALTEIRTYLLGQDTAALQTDASGYVKVSDGTGTGQIDLTSGGVLVSTLATQAKADVNAEVVDCLNTDTYAEPGQGAPGATISLAAKIAYLYTSWRNKKDNDGTTTNLYADNGSTILMKQTTASAGGTVSKAEWITGA